MPQPSTEPTTSQNSANGINSLFQNNPYFTAVDETLPVAGFVGTPFTKLKPVSKVVDVVSDMHWSNPFSDKSEVPIIFVREKELQYGAWATQLANLLTEGSQLVEAAGTAIANGLASALPNTFSDPSTLKNADSYVQLYAANDTGFYYNFPWLLKSGESIRAIRNQWNSIQGLGDILSNSNSSKSEGKTAALVGAGVGAVVGALTPGFGFEDTKQYESTNEQEVTITFPLYNTIDPQTAFKHFCFVNLFTFQNLKTRTSLMTFIPPKIYEVDAYATGGLYMAAAYVTDFKVDSIGTTRALSDYGGYILIPEAYKITITFRDLLSQSSNVFAGVLGGTKVQVTNAGAPITNLGNAFGTVGNAIGNFGKAVANAAGIK
jgi:hypothetical protein